MGKVEKDTIEGRLASLRGKRGGIPHRLGTRRHKTARIFPLNSPITRNGIANYVRENYEGSYPLAVIDTLSRMSFDVEDAGNQIEEKGLGHYINSMLPEAERRLAIRETEGRGSAKDLLIGVHMLKMMRDWYFEKQTPPEGFPTPGKEGDVPLTGRIEAYRRPKGPNSQ